MRHCIYTKPFVARAIQSGRKDLEVRVADRWHAPIKVGDIIVFSTSCERVVAMVRRYTSFVAMLEHEDAGRIMPGWTAAEVLVGLKAIYSPRKEALGVLVFELQSTRP